MIDAEHLIRKLDLREHPYEGGYFKEIYRATDLVSYDELLLSNQTRSSIPKKKRFRTKTRPASTLIYYLLNKNQISPIHRVKNDEIWHFYLGSPLIIYLLNDEKYPTIVKLGNNLEDGEEYCLNYAIKKESWFCAEVYNKKSFSLVGCTVSPGFDFEDFQLGNKTDLLLQYPQYSSIIEKFAK